MPKNRRKKERLLKREADYSEAKLLNSETKKSVAIVLLLMLAFLSILAIFNLAGDLGATLKKGLENFLGWGLYLFPLFLLLLGYFLLNPEKYQITARHYLGLFLLLLSSSGLWQLINQLNTGSLELAAGQGGGYLGYGLSWPLQRIASAAGAWVIVLALFFIALLITFNTSLDTLLSRLNLFSLFRRRWENLQDNEETTTPGETTWNEDEPLEEVEDTETGETAAREQKTTDGFTAKKIVPASGGSQATAPKKTRALPEGLKVTYASGRLLKTEVPLELLDGRTSKPTSGDIKANLEKIQGTLKNFGIEVEMGGVNVGPTVTQFTLKPAEGVKLAQIVTLQNDLALALAAHPIRIEAPIPGKSLVGIEVPNQSIALVKLKEILTSDEFSKKRGRLLFALGKDVAGHAWVADLASMPHLLIAGATGSGKSVCINNIIVSFLYRHSPQSLRMILIDPKRVEFTTYNGIPHLLTPVITEVDKTINALRWVVNEMDERYRLLSAVNKRNLEAYNASVLTNRLPYIVVVIDELADLMATAPREVEGAIIRLAQMARATGIHLTVATQRPSVNVITGLIKANITSRIAFAVASQIDSRTIIDTSGAEKLLGKGDMLFSSAELSKPRRLQSALVTDEEIERVADFWKNQAEPEYNESVTAKQGRVNLPGLSDLNDNGDELLEEAKAIVIKADKASASLLQRRLRVGYARAARLLDLLEERGIIGPGDGAKPREIMVSDNDYLGIPVETTERYAEEEPDNTEDGPEENIEEK